MTPPTPLPFTVEEYSDEELEEEELDEEVEEEEEDIEESPVKKVKKNGAGKVRLSFIFTSSVSVLIRRSK